MHSTQLPSIYPSPRLHSRSPFTLIIVIAIAGLSAIAVPQFAQGDHLSHHSQISRFWGKCCAELVLDRTENLFLSSCHKNRGASADIPKQQSPKSRAARFHWKMSSSSSLPPDSNPAESGNHAGDGGNEDLNPQPKTNNQSAARGRRKKRRGGGIGRNRGGGSSKRHRPGAAVASFPGRVVAMEDAGHGVGGGEEPDEPDNSAAADGSKQNKRKSREQQERRSLQKKLVYEKQKTARKEG